MIVISDVFVDLFVDFDLYASLYPDLEAAGLTTEQQLLEHLQNVGVAEGRQFSLFLDLQFYGNSNSDLAGLNNEQLLDHLQNFGLAEGRQFSPFVDLDFYRANNTDLAGLSNQQLVEHLRNFGIDEGRQFSAFVDLDFYQNSNPDLADLSNEELFEHLQTFGIAEGRQFSSLVDLNFYRSSYSDLTSLTNEQLAEHLQQFGFQEGRRFSPVVDLNLYLAGNPDLQAAFGDDTERLVRHLEEFGIEEGRTFAEDLDLRDYLADNPDVDEAVEGSLEGALEHLLIYGINEGRLPQYFAAENYQTQAAQRFIEAFEQTFVNPTTFSELADVMAEGVVWTIPPQPQLFGVTEATQLVGDAAIEAFFGQALTAFFPTGFEALEFLPSTDPLENQIAVRVAQTGVGSQSGREYEGDITFLLTVDGNGLIQAFEFYSNSYPLQAAALDSEVPGIPDDDPLTTQPVTIDQSADTAAAVQVAVSLWEALINGNFDPEDPLSFPALNAPDVVWSFAVGGPDLLPYAGAAQGLVSAQGGGVIPELLGPLGAVVTPGNLSIVETFADGNRVLVRLREEGAIATETNTPYDLDILSWITVENGQVQSNQVIVDSYRTVNALRPGDTSPLSEARRSTRHVPPFFVTGSRINTGVLAFDQAGDFQGVFFEANNLDAPELLQPIGLTYGPDGNLYVTTTLSTDGATVANAVLRFGGVYGNYLDNPDTRDPENLRLTSDTNPGIFGDAYGDGSLVNAVTGAPFNFATDNPALLAPGLIIPTGIKFGPDGNFYVASGFTSRILQYDGVTGDFLGAFATRPNGALGNVLDPAANPRPDFSVFVFGPDGNIYVASIRTDPDENDATGYGGVLRIAGPNSATPGQFLGLGEFGGLGVYGEAYGDESGLTEPSALAFGPDLDLYVASAQTGEVLEYAGPFAANPGEFLGVFADVESAIRQDTGSDLPVVLAGLGFGPDGNLYVGSSLEVETGAPVGGSQYSIFAGPNSANPGEYLGAYGEVTTAVSRLLLPTTPEFVFYENSYTQAGTPTQRFPQIDFVVGVNTDRPFDATVGLPGFFLSDETDAIAAYDSNRNFLGYLGTDLTNGSLGTNVPSGVDNPLNGIGGIILGPSGNILVSSQLSDQVLEYSSLTGQLIGVFGDASFEGSGLNFPAGIAVSQTNTTVFVSDLENERILRFDGYSGEFLDDPATPENEGVLAQSGEDGGRFTDIAFGPDGRLYVGYNVPFGVPVLGEGEVRVYNPETGVLENTITGLDFAAALEFGPDDNLYIADDPASLGVDPLTGQPLIDPATGQFKESSIAVYNIDNRHPLLTNAEGQGDPNGQRVAPELLREFNVGFGNSGAITLDQDGTIYLSSPVSGVVSLYNPTGELLGTLGVPLPGAALLANGGVDENGLPRPTGSTFIAEGFA